MSENRPNELRADFLSAMSLNPFMGHNSSSRLQMFHSHLGQKLNIKGATERRIQTGLEAEFAKYTFKIKMPCDAMVIKVIERYKPTIHKDSISLNPQTVVIYEDVQTKEVGVVNLPTYCSYHQYFGFEYQKSAATAKLSPGQFIPKDTVFLDSPAVTPDGGYKFGIELNMAFMTHPAVSEDGIMISSDVLDKLSFKIYETRVVEWGSKRFPLNLYGDVSKFKAFPDVGEVIRDDGILMAFREYDETLPPVEQSLLDLTEVDILFDRCVYANGAGGKIIDIRIYHDENPLSPTPVGMDIQTQKYLHAKREFHSEIVSEYRRLKKNRGDSLRTSKEFDRMVVEGLGVLDEDPKNKLNKVYRQTAIDDYRVEFTIEYEVVPTTGFKLTCGNGGKGVICYVASPEEMPVDEAGNRADIVMDPNSTVSRMNLGRLYEHYINGACRDMQKRLIAQLGFNPNAKDLFRHFTQLSSDNALVKPAYDTLMHFYSLISTKMYNHFSTIDSAQQKEHLFSVLKDGVYLFMPTDNEIETVEIIKQLENFYPPTYGKVTYKNTKGQTCTTTENVRVASLYMMLLEKIGDDWAAVSSGKLQNFGILAQLTKADKYSQPTRNQAVRVVGETEGRILVSYCGQPMVAEVMDRNNNPLTHKNIVWNVLDADKPTNIDFAVDRKKIRYGGAKPIQLVNHVLMCAGIKFQYKDDKAC